MDIPLPKTPVIGASSSHITSDFWDGYWRRSILSSIHLLANLFDPYPVAIPEVFAKVNSIRSFLNSELAMIFWVRGVWNRKIILRLRCKCNIYIKLSGFNVCYSKFRPHDVLKGTCLWSFHMLVMVTQQQDGRKKRTVKRLCVTKVAWLILACCVVIFT